MQCMNKFFMFFMLLIGCASTNIPSCDLCGRWSFERFDYTGYITTDCEDTANRFYKNTSIIIDKNSFSKTYYTDNIQNEIIGVHIVLGEYDKDEGSQELFIKSENQTIETLYKLTPNTFYLLSDGCRFYFKKEKII